MAITQPGDTTVISPLSVPGDAGPAVRAESVQGGFVALTGSGPPDTTRLPLVMRRIGQFAYTPTDNKFWQLVGGVADANWTGRDVGKGGLVTVATNADRDALPSSVKTEGMIVYSQQTQCYYSLGTDLSTWTFIDANPALNTQSVWVVKASTGSDTNDGKTSGTALASLDELCRRLNPAGKTLKVAQSTAINIIDGTFNSLELSISIPVGSNYTFDVVCTYTSSSPITLSSVVDTVPSATPVRGRITTASGTFVDKKRIRSTSGASAGAITYCTGLTSSTDAWVKRWFLESSFVPVNIANGTTCVVDTLQVTINRLQIKTTGHPLGGSIRVFDATLPNGAEIVNTIGGSSALFLSQCQIGSASVSRASGNVQFRNCRFVGPGTTAFIGGVLPVISGCVFENTLTVLSTVQLFGSNCFNGGSLFASGLTATIQSSVSAFDNELVNGTGTAVTVGPGCILQIFDQQYGFGSSYAVGYALSAGATIVTDTIAHASGILATQPVTMAGKNVPYSDLPVAFPRAACAFVLLSDPTAAPFRAPARFGATFYVDPAYTGFSDGTESCPYPSVTAAIAAAPTGALIKMAPYAVSTENVTFPAGFLWEVQSEAGIDSSPGNIVGNITIGGTSNTVVTLTNVTVTGTVTGAVSTAHCYLFTNNTDINGGINLTSSGAGYWSVNCFANGASSTQIDNGQFLSTTSVAGEIVGNGWQFQGAVSFTRATKLVGCLLNSGSVGIGSGLLLQDTTFVSAPTFTGSAVVTMDGYSHASALAAGGITLAGGATIAILNSVNPSGIQQSGATSNQALTWNGSAWIPTSLSSTQITNSSSVSGSTVTAALNTLLAGIGGGGAVSSVFSRTGAIVAALNDYTSSLIQNLSSVSSGGSTVTTALNALQSQATSISVTVAGLVTGVSSAFGRGGAVIAVNGDYNSTQITNGSGVSGASVTAALNTLDGRATGVSSVFGRGNNVLAVSGDYNSSQVTNSSTVSGANVTNALDALLNQNKLSFSSVRNVSTSTYTLDKTDRNGFVFGSSSSAQTFTMPSFSLTDVPIGSRIIVYQYGNGPITIVPAGGVVVRSATGVFTTQLSASFVLDCYSADEWVLNAYDTPTREFHAVTATTSNHTLGPNDQATLLDCSGSGSVVVSIPLIATHKFPIGGRASFVRSNALGTVTLGVAGGVTVYGILPTTIPVGAIVNLTYWGSDKWFLSVEPSTSSDLYDFSVLSAGNVTGALNALASRSFNGAVQFPICPVAGTFQPFGGPSTAWYLGANHVWTTTNAGTILLFPAALSPSGGTVIGAKIRIKPPGGHGVLPTPGMPQLTLYIYQGGSSSSVTTVDSSSTLFAYETEHDIVMTGLSLSGPSLSLMMEVLGETNLSGTQLISASLIYG